MEIIVTATDTPETAQVFLNFAKRTGWREKINDPDTGSLIDNPTTVLAHNAAYITGHINELAETQAAVDAQRAVVEAQQAAMQEGREAADAAARLAFKATFETAGIQITAP